MVLDGFPTGAEQHRNDRFNSSRRTRDTQCEEEQFLVIENLLNRYQDERVRLHELQSEGEDQEGDEVATEERAEKRAGDINPDADTVHCSLPGHGPPDNHRESPPPRSTTWDWAWEQEVPAAIVWLGGK